VKHDLFVVLMVWWLVGGGHIWVTNALSRGVNVGVYIIIAYVATTTQPHNHTTTQPHNHTTTTTTTQPHNHTTTQPHNHNHNHTTTQPHNQKNKTQFVYANGQ
jgi:ABC-type nickel/cobalt efflux system permease component RcnA